MCKHIKVVRHTMKRGCGDSITIEYPIHNPIKCWVSFHRKIKGGDVHDGKLIPTTTNYMVKRGGERETTLLFENNNVDDLVKIS